MARWSYSCYSANVQLLCKLLHLRENAQIPAEKATEYHQHLFDTGRRKS